ncbi:hypothetical protein GGI42DRAFT_360329 [Trichoderma sp. SZMC 28013]
MADHMNNVVADLASVFTRGGQAKYRGEFRLVGSIPQNANEPWTPRVEFPSVYFVDRYVFQQHRIHIPTACPGTSAFPTVFIGATHAEQDSYVSAFFNGVHRWLPVLDEERFRARLVGKTPAELPADMALLLLFMRLITSAPSESSRNGTRTDLYLAAKQGFLNLEMAGVLSVECLEAGLLISLYEISHAIYPSAFLSVGACTRYGQAMGFGGPNALKLRPPYNRSELEESRRLWWAVVLLDRYLNLGSPSQLASIHDPPDDGSMSQETANANSFGSSKLGRRDQGCPALIAQATRLLGKVLRHTSHNYRSELDLEDQCLEVGSSLRQRQENEFSQLGRTIASLIDAAETEARKWAVPIEEQLMICYSSLLALYNHYEACKGNHTQWDEQTLAAVEATRVKVIERCKDLLSDPASSLESISPFFLHCIYMVAISSQSVPQTGTATKDVLVKALGRLERRWQAAGRKRDLRQALCLAQRVYAKAVEEIQNAMSTISSDTIYQVMLAMMLMGGYENVMYFTRESPALPSDAVGSRFWKSVCHEKGAASLLSARRERGFEADTELDKAIRQKCAMQLRIIILRGGAMPAWLEDGSNWGEEGHELELDSLIIRVLTLRNKSISFLRDMDDASPEIIDEVKSVAMEAYALDYDLALWPLGLAQDWKFQVSRTHSKPNLNAADALANTTSHTYSSVGHAAIWNRYRALRLITNSIQKRAFFALKSLSDGSFADTNMQRCQININNLAADLRCGVEFSLTSHEPARGAEATTFLDTPHPSVAALLAWPLTVAVSVDAVEPPEKTWMKGALKAVARSLGHTLLESVSDNGEFKF